MRVHELCSVGADTEWSKAGLDICCENVSGMLLSLYGMESSGRLSTAYSKYIVTGVVTKVQGEAVCKYAWSESTRMFCFPKLQEAEKDKVIVVHCMMWSKSNSCSCMLLLSTCEHSNNPVQLLTEIWWCKKLWLCLNGNCVAYYYWFQQVKRTQHPITNRQQP